MSILLASFFCYFPTFQPLHSHEEHCSMNYLDLGQQRHILTLKNFSLLLSRLLFPVSQSPSRLLVAISFSVVISSLFFPTGLEVNKTATSASQNGMDSINTNWYKHIFLLRYAFWGGNILCGGPVFFSSHVHPLWTSPCDLFSTVFVFVSHHDNSDSWILREQYKIVAAHLGAWEGFVAGWFPLLSCCRKVSLSNTNEMPHL